MRGCGSRPLRCVLPHLQRGAVRAVCACPCRACRARSACGARSVCACTAGVGGMWVPCVRCVQGMPGVQDVQGVQGIRCVRCVQCVQCVQRVCGRAMGSQCAYPAATVGLEGWSCVWLSLSPLLSPAVAGRRRGTVCARVCVGWRDAWCYKPYRAVRVRVRVRAVAVATEADVCGSCVGGQRHVQACASWHRAISKEKLHIRHRIITDAPHQLLLWDELID